MSRVSRTIRLKRWDWSVSSEGKFRFATSIILLFFCILVARLWYLQVRSGTLYSSRAEQNRIRTLYVAGPRGDILDKDGRELVSTRPSFNLIWAREDAPDADMVLGQVSSFLGLDKSAVLSRIRQSAELPRHIPVRLMEDIDWATLARVEIHRMDLPGIRIEIVPQRSYSHPEFASHLIGYLGEINRKEMEEKKWENYRLADLIGKQGLEKVFESYLRGDHGITYLEVDAVGYLQKELKVQDSRPGHTVRLTLDSRMQQAAEQAMAGRAGAVLALEAKSGRVLAYVSAPALDLARMNGSISPAYWNALKADERVPLVNKPIHGIYPPGSTFKIVTAVAALATGAMTPETTVLCRGHLEFGNRSYGCWKKGGHGTVSLRRALAESCDVYFYTAGMKVGIDRLASFAHAFGLGAPTGIPLENEKGGLFPSSAWKRKRHKQPWHQGETLSVAIGQGYTQVTPLQIAMMTMVVANGGTFYRPQYVEQIRTPTGNPIKGFVPAAISELPAAARENLSLIREALADVVNVPGGTARSARLPDVVVAGKTGTAQVVQLAKFKGVSDDKIPYKYKDHAWFTSFAPAENAEIVVTVLLEHGGHGGSVAAPVARQVMEAYFAGKKGLEPVPHQKPTTPPVPATPEPQQEGQQ